MRDSEFQALYRPQLGHTLSSTSAGTQTPERICLKRFAGGDQCSSM